MPQFLDEAQVHSALENEAIPLLNQLANNPAIHSRSLRRFDRDSPPPYRSSTEEELEPTPPRRIITDGYEAEIRAIMDPPLTSDEMDWVATKLVSYGGVWNAGALYRGAQDTEEERLNFFSRGWFGAPPSAKLKNYFKGRAGRERGAIVARRNIKRRWQKLGVWNPEWGIPGPLESSSQDETKTWAWRWPQAEWTHGTGWNHWIGAANRNPDHPIVRLMRLRQGLRREEHAPMPPFSKLSSDAGVAAAESFIFSRPWLLMQVEIWEEEARCERLTFNERLSYRGSTTSNVLKRWKQTDRIKAEWVDLGKAVLVGWKWAHESPSPEPEDLAPLTTESMEYTPSEADALEAVRSPTPPTPPTPPPKPFPAHLIRPIPEGSIFGTGPRLAAVPSQPAHPTGPNISETGPIQPTIPSSPPPAYASRAFADTSSLHGDPALVSHLRSRKRHRQEEESAEPQPQPPPLRRSPRIAARLTKERAQSQAQNTRRAATTQQQPAEEPPRKRPRRNAAADRTAPATTSSARAGRKGAASGAGLRGVSVGQVLVDDAKGPERGTRSRRKVAARKDPAPVRESPSTRRTANKPVSARTPLATTVDGQKKGRRAKETGQGGARVSKAKGKGKGKGTPGGGSKAPARGKRKSTKRR